jgi:hypothetical protein
MKGPGEEEHQRVLGFRTSIWPWLESGRESPHDGDKGRQGALPFLRHPIAWIRWRIAVRHQGPYAPDFKEFRRRKQPDQSDFH